MMAIAQQEIERIELQTIATMGTAFADLEDLNMNGTDVLCEFGQQLATWANNQQDPEEKRRDSTALFQQAIEGTQYHQQIAQWHSRWAKHWYGHWIGDWREYERLFVQSGRQWRAVIEYQTINRLGAMMANAWDPTGIIRYIGQLLPTCFPEQLPPEIPAR